MALASLSVSLLLLLLSCSHLKSSATDCKEYNDTLKNLGSLRKILVKLEDTIVMCVIQRSNIPRNSLLYHDTRLVPCTYTSLFDFFIKQSEAVQAQAGRYYLSEEENAFYPKILPSSLVPSSTCIPVLHPGARIDVNNRILDMYVKWLLPKITSNGDDGKYASTAAADLTCLQALSKRINYGKFVAEAKFVASPENYTRAIKRKDRKTLMKLLTVEKVEQEVKNRVADKTRVFSQDVDQGLNDGASGRFVVDPKTVYQLYEDYVINLTKDVEVDYLFQRLN